MRRDTLLGIHEIYSFSYLPWPYFDVTIMSGSPVYDPTAARKTAAAVSLASASSAAATGKTIRENGTPGRRENSFHEIKPQPFRRTYTFQYENYTNGAQKQNDGDANIARDIPPDL